MGRERIAPKRAKLRRIARRTVAHPLQSVCCEQTHSPFDSVGRSHWWNGWPAAVPPPAASHDSDEAHQKHGSTTPGAALEVPAIASTTVAVVLSLAARQEEQSSYGEHRVAGRAAVG